MPFLLLEVAVWMLDGMIAGEKEAWVAFFVLIFIIIFLLVLLIVFGGDR